MSRNHTNEYKEKQIKRNSFSRKRFLAILAVMALVLSGCGSSQTTDSSAADQTVISTETAGSAGEGDAAAVHVVRAADVVADAAPRDHRTI